MSSTLRCHFPLLSISFLVCGRRWALTTPVKTVSVGLQETHLGFYLLTNSIVGMSFPIPLLQSCSYCEKFPFSFVSFIDSVLLPCKSVSVVCCSSVFWIWYCTRLSIIVVIRENEVWVNSMLFLCFPWKWTMEIIRVLRFDNDDK